jgi:carbon monoxide dehydrogenase subunit G
MIAVSTTQHVPAPPHRVFAFLNRPENHAEITPAMTQSREIGRMPNGGARAAYVYRIAGVPFRGTVEAREFAPGERIVFAVGGDIEGTIRLDLAPEADGTRVTYAADYDLPGLGRLKAARPVAKAINARVLRRTLKNLSAALAR